MQLELAQTYAVGSAHPTKILLELAQTYAVGSAHPTKILILTIQSPRGGLINLVRHADFASLAAVSTAVEFSEGR
jgi:hypothetical protein